MKLERLAEPFPAEDIEWRVSRAGKGRSGIYCNVLAYITARAIQARLDEVCGAGEWRVEQPQVLSINGKSAFAVGISIRIDGEWITKWDVAEPTNVEPAKGGFSGAMKRAGAQWGIGRYLYHLDEAFAEVADTDPRVKGWNYARLPEKHGGDIYYWKAPALPGWAMPKEPEHEINERELTELKNAWRKKFAGDVKNPGVLLEGFRLFVESICGKFPITDYTCWTRDAFDKCKTRIEQHTESDGVSSDVPFEGANA